MAILDFKVNEVEKIVMFDNLFRAVAFKIVRKGRSWSLLAPPTFRFFKSHFLNYFGPTLIVNTKYAPPTSQPSPPHFIIITTPPHCEFIFAPKHPPLTFLDGTVLIYMCILRPWNLHHSFKLYLVSATHVVIRLFQYLWEIKQVRIGLNIFLMHASQTQSLLLQTKCMWIIGWLN